MSIVLSSSEPVSFGNKRTIVGKASAWIGGGLFLPHRYLKGHKVLVEGQGMYVRYCHQLS